jgi:tRNA(Ile)-lysidine synthase
MDSMVLLHLLSHFCETYDLSLIVAHVNHGLRPEESEKEAELVQKEAGRLGFPFEYGIFNVKEFQKLGGLSLQDAARRIRFHFFNDLLQKHHAQKIALGHHADDQVETVLLRLLRGSGLEGLKGILPIREGRIIRPLIEVWKGEIQSFALEKKVSFLFDSSNLKKDYLRNRLRLFLIPMIEKEYQPNFKEILLRTSTLLRGENDFLEDGAARAYQKMVKEENDTLSFRFSEYQSLHQAIRWRIIRRMLARVYARQRVMDEGEGLDVHKIDQKLHQSSPSFLLELPHGVWVEKRYDLVLLGKESVEAIPPFEVELNCPGRNFIGEIGKEVFLEETNMDRFMKFKGLPHTAFLDYESLQFPLRIRNFRPGDRFHPLGAKGTQKLKEFFIDHKVPKFERSNIPLIISAETIAWVVGYRIDERVKVIEKTKRILKVIVV